MKKVKDRQVVAAEKILANHGRFSSAASCIALPIFGIRSLYVTWLIFLAYDEKHE